MLTQANLLRLCRGRDMLRDDDRPVTAIAEKLGVSSFHFIRQFRAVFGETPNRYRVRHRLERARTKLSLGDASITEICMEVGYSSLGSFSTLFSRHFGRSPASYRKQVAAEPVDLAPHCLSLLQEAWQREAQFSRSQTTSSQGTKPLMSPAKERKE